jgi:hypothetical protein
MGRTCERPGCDGAVTGLKRKRFCSKSCATQFNRAAGKVHRLGKTFACEACGKSFYRYPSDIAKGNERGSRMRYCSKACENAHRAAHNVEATCERCGSEFVVWPSRISYNHAHGIGAARFCSAECRNIANPTSNGRSGHRVDLDHFVRSSWEANVCRLLTSLGIPYEYEPRTFPLPNGSSYRPDLRVAGTFWLEVKGYMWPAAAEKIAAFRITYPDEPLIVVAADEYAALEGSLANLIPSWE